MHSLGADCNRMTKAGLKASIPPTYYLPVQEGLVSTAYAHVAQWSLHGRAR